MLNNGDRIETVTVGYGEDAVGTPIARNNVWIKTAKPIITQWAA